MKRKTITLVVYMLVCMSLVSVGFAAWVITGGTETTAQAGIQASAVTDKSLNISNGKWYQDGVEVKDDSGAAANAQIVFGKPENQQLVDSNWLRWDNAGVPDQKLEATYKFTLTVGDGNGETLKQAFNKTGSQITFAIDPQHSDALTAVTETKKYISAPTLTYYIGNQSYATQEELFAALTNSEAKSVEMSIEIEFAWGSDLGNQNPFSHFNAIAKPTQDDKTAAKNALNALLALNGASYELSIVLAGNK